MVIQKEYFGFKGTAYIRTYSDLPGYGVEREGIVYVEAVDPAILHREYTEVFVGLPPEEETPQVDPNQEVNNDQIPIQDYSQNP